MIIGGILLVVGGCYWCCCKNSQQGANNTDYHQEHHHNEGFEPHAHGYELGPLPQPPAPVMYNNGFSGQPGMVYNPYVQNPGINAPQNVHGNGGFNYPTH